MYYLNSRYYDPEIGRFISPDTTDILEVQDDLYDKNLYAYCDNNPVMRVDSSGAVWHLAVGAAVGVATQFIADVGIGLATGSSFGEIMSLSPMPKKKKVRKPFMHHCPWKVGSLLAYRIVINKDKSVYPCFGKYVLKELISKLEPLEYYNESMLVGLYGWIGDEITDSQIVEKLQFIPITGSIQKLVNPIDFLY